jgi:hypothetical protein
MAQSLPDHGGKKSPFSAPRRISAVAAKPPRYYIVGGEELSTVPEISVLPADDIFDGLQLRPGDLLAD